MREIRPSGSMRGCRKRAATRRACALLYGGSPLVGGTRPPRLSPEGKRERGDGMPCCRRLFLLCLAQPLKPILALFPQSNPLILMFLAVPKLNRRLALLPFALFVEP